MRRIRLVAVVVAVWLAAGPARAELPPEQRPANLPDLVATLLPAVVNISTLSQQPGPGGSVAQGGEMMMSAPLKEYGSGFIVDPSGYIVTNRHVIAGAYKVTVTLDDGQPYPAEVVSANERPDLALLKIETGRALPTVPWGNSDDLRIGQTVIAIGNPLGLASSVSVGVISALNRDLSETMIDDFIQTDAAINHGNSGGPLFNLRGQVIGVNWALFTPNAVKLDRPGSASPSRPNDASFVVGEMRKYGHLRPGFVGLRLQQVTPEIAGCAAAAQRRWRHRHGGLSGRPGRPGGGATGRRRAASRSSPHRRCAGFVARHRNDVARHLDGDGGVARWQDPHASGRGGILAARAEARTIRSGRR